MRAAHYFTTWSLARGGCGHRHKHQDTALKCSQRDKRSAFMIGARGIYRVESDRVLYELPGMPGIEEAIDPQTLLQPPFWQR